MRRRKSTGVWTWVIVGVVLGLATTASAQIEQCVAAPPHAHDGGEAYQRILGFITDEMRVNSASEDVQYIKDNVNGICQGGIGLKPACHPLALIRWKDKVCAGCVWDHKAKIKDMLGDREYTDLPDMDAELYFDVWSNIHYGYVGREAGISRTELELAPQLSTGSTGTNDAVDVITVQIGMDLWNRVKPGQLTAEHVSSALLGRLHEFCSDDYHVRRFASFTQGFGDAPEEGFEAVCEELREVGSDEPSTCGNVGEGEGSDGEGTGSEPPQLTVSAGPNVAGTVDDEIALKGKAPEGARLSWRYARGQNVDPQGSCEFTSQAATTGLRCDRPGNYIVTLQGERDGQTAKDSAIVWVSNRAPKVAIDAPTPWLVVDPKQTVELKATITDSSYDKHTCQVRWDDAQTAQTDSQEGHCSTSHSYADSGMYTLRLTVTDSSGARTTANVLVIVRAGLGASVDVRAKTRTRTDADQPWLIELHTRAGKHIDAVGGGVLFDGNFPKTILDDIIWTVVTPGDRFAVRASTHAFGGETMNVLVFGQDGCMGRGLAPCEDDSLRLVIWPAAAGDVPPSAAIVHDDLPGQPFELDDTVLLPVTRGVVDIDQSWSTYWKSR